MKFGTTQLTTDGKKFDIVNAPMHPQKCVRAAEGQGVDRAAALQTPITAAVLFHRSERNGNHSDGMAAL
jgi:hypothetical protein